MDVRAFQVKDVYAKNYVLLRSKRWGESFWAGTSTRTSVRKINPKTEKQPRKWLLYPCFEGQFSVYYKLTRKTKITFWGLK